MEAIDIHTKDANLLRDSEYNKNLSCESITTDLESWLASYQGGWSQEDRIMAHAYETGMTNELDFDIEDYQANEWHKWLATITK